MTIFFNLGQCRMIECNEDPSSSGQEDTQPPKNFRLQGSCFLLTWPRCSTSKETVLERLKTMEHIEWAIVCTEKHQDGTPHLHAAVKFLERIRSRNPRHFDFCAESHGNYQACRSTKGAVRYVVKYGTYVSHNLDVDSYLSISKSQKAATMVSQGKTLKQVYDQDPGFFLLHKRKIEELSSWLNQMNQVPKLTWKKIEESAISLMNSQNRLIFEWLNQNLFQKRPYGSLDLYIYGATKMGKTSLVNWLDDYCRIYWLPPQEDFYDEYDDDCYDLCVLDEFRANKTIQFLNSWCQQSVLPLKKKGITNVLKRKHLPTIILSNYSLEECYSEAVKKNSNILDPLYRRLQLVYVCSPINLP